MMLKRGVGVLKLCSLREGAFMNVKFINAIISLLDILYSHNDINQDY